MTKRRLNRRQQWRINRIQQERLARAARRDAASAVADGDLLEETPGLVVLHHGKLVHVEDEARITWRCHFRATLDQLVVGDRVLFRPPRSGDTGVVTAIAPRRTELRRPDPYGNLKPVAANVDQLLIVYAPLPTPSSALLDRYLVAAELSGIRPVLVLNKADLVDDVLRPALDELADIYRALGYRVLEASSVTATGLDALAAELAGRTSVFVGQSGVGKSSLVNRLLPDAGLEVGDVSATSGLGQHTTVAARLLHLPEGGDVIDSPGIREFGLWHISEEELLRGYVELAALAGECRFRNCSHRHEPGCALRAAADAGRISAERLRNFFAIAETLDDAARARY